nr:hypothetical protein [Tanacetum cinerariifolium]
MRLEGCDSWDRTQGNMGCWEESIGTVPVSVGAQECRVREKGVLAGNGVIGLLKVWANDTFGPCGISGF